MTKDKYISYKKAETVSMAVNTRRSIRAFTDVMPPHGLLDNILQSAARAPSGTNIQPWKVYVVTGNARKRLCLAASAAFDDPDAQHEIEVSYYPTKWFEPYLGRRRKLGWDLYGLLGIKKGDRDKTRKQHRRNYQFFDAPVGLIFTLHRELATGSWLDYGMFMQNIMLLAREAGLHTCAQAAWADYHTIVREQLRIDVTEVVVCGMAIGYADESAIENTLVSERSDLAEFVRYIE